MNPYRRSLATLFVGACLSAATGYAQELRSTAEYRPDQVIIRIDQAQFEQLAFVEHMIGATGHTRVFENDIWLLDLPKGSDARKVAEMTSTLPYVKYAVPNMIVQAVGVPNDPGFSNQWGFQQPNDHDIDAPEAWDEQTDASPLVVAVIDTGTQWDHPDLAANIWTNTGEIPGNGIDDDGNGYIDDVHGYDWVNLDGNPMDDYGHGTHTAGTIGAVTNNGTGVAGVCWKVRIMPLKFLNSGGSGSISDAVLALEYAMNNGANLSSNSWGCYCSDSDMQPLSDAIDEAFNTKGMLFVAAAGNNGSDNDQTPFYPASLHSKAIFSVAASDANDNLAGFSNYGRTSVDIAAPGDGVYSTWLGSSYTYLSGTSMACPHAAGAVALAAAHCPNSDLLRIRNKIMASADQLPAFMGKVASNGRLNLRGALDACPCAVSFKTTGTGLGGSGGQIPAMTGTDGGCDTGGYSMHISNGLGGATGVLWLGLHQGSAPFYGGQLYIDFSQPWTLFPITLGGAAGVAGAGFLDFNGIDVNVHEGLTLILQGSFLDPAAVQGVSLTAGLKMIID
jgi:subtilisin family serine protease